MDKPRALLLIGPSGSGKSPLGALLEKRMGWAHFDFGHQLRIVARDEEIPGLTVAERNYIKELLSSHSLFPDESFPIIEKILNYFLERNVHAPGIILNGLPRHIGQAISISNIFDIQRVAVLECSGQTSFERTMLRKKGLSDDHAGRADDTPKAVAKKFNIYTQHTAPIVEHYESIGAQVMRIPVGNGTSESQIATKIIESIR
jgi:adenylate kinase family enzyme